MTPTEGADMPVPQQLSRLMSETVTGAGTDALPLAGRVFEAMRARLSSVLGAGGYAMLLKRTLLLLRPAHPWLASVTVDNDGNLVVDEAQEQNAVVVGAAFGAVLTRFARLLATFIGDDLRDRLLDLVWRDLQGDGTDNGENRA